MFNDSQIPFDHLKCLRKALYKKNPKNKSRKLDFDQNRKHASLMCTLLSKYISNSYPNFEGRHRLISEIQGSHCLYHVFVTIFKIPGLDLK